MNAVTREPTPAINTVENMFLPFPIMMNDSNTIRSARWEGFGHTDRLAELINKKNAITDAGIGNTPYLLSKTYTKMGIKIVKIL